MFAATRYAANKMSVATRQATKIWPSSNAWNGSILRGRAVSYSKER